MTIHKETFWPDFDFRTLGLSPPATYQLNRAYSDILEKKSGPVKRKGDLLKFICDNSICAKTGTHIPVASRADTGYGTAARFSRELFETRGSFPADPPTFCLFANPLFVFDDVPSARPANIGRIIVTLEHDTQSREEFEQVLALLRGEKERPIDELDAMLRCFREYRGFSAVYSGRRSAHFHFVFDLAHMVNIPLADEGMLPNPSMTGLLSNAHDWWWDKLNHSFTGLLKGSLQSDRSMRSLFKWRRMPFGIRVLDKPCPFLNLSSGMRVPQIVIHEKIRERAQKESDWGLPPSFSFSELQLRRRGKASAQGGQGPTKDDCAVVASLQELCAEHWGQPYPKPVSIAVQNGQHRINFVNGPDDNNPSSIALGNHSAVKINGRSQLEDIMPLPLGLTANDLVRLCASQSGEGELHEGLTRERKPNAHPILDGLERGFANLERARDPRPTRDIQSRLIRSAVDELRSSDCSYILVGPEGLGKSLVHLADGSDEIFNATVDDLVRRKKHREACGGDGTRPPGKFLCFASRSLEQARKKAAELQKVRPRVKPVIIQGFGRHYEEACAFLNEDPMPKATGESNLEWYERIRSDQPDVFERLEEVRLGLWNGDFTGGLTVLFTSHGTIQTWEQNRFSRCWHHPDFDPDDPKGSIDAGLAKNFVISLVVFDEIERDAILTILWQEDLHFIRWFKDYCPGWLQLPRHEKLLRFIEACKELPDRRRHGMTLDKFDEYVRTDLKKLVEIAVDFDSCPFGHGPKAHNVYASLHGQKAFISIKDWPFGNWRIGVLTTESLPTAIWTQVFIEEQKRARRSKDSQERLKRARLNTFEARANFAYSIPYVIDDRARSDGGSNNGISKLVAEIVAQNPNAVIIADGVDHERVTNFQRMKGANDLSDRDIYIIMTHLHPDVYAELNILGQFAGIEDAVAVHYIDLINQAAGRNGGFRKSDLRDAETIFICGQRWSELMLPRLRAVSARAVFVPHYRTATQRW